MKLKCVEKGYPCDWLTVGKVYGVHGMDHDTYKIIDDRDQDTYVMKEGLCENLSHTACHNVFEIVDESVATLRSIQEQCSRANMSISIDPEGFNIFDCDTDMQTMVHSVEDAVEILKTKLEYKDSMGKWGWM